jgi:GDP-L-fucose synthase
MSDLKIFVAGHNGLVGSALVRRLAAGGYRNIVTRSRAELDLLDQPAVHRFMDEQRPDYILMAAAKVGGIHANNTARADFLYDNLAIATHIVHAAHAAGVSRMLFLGSSCIYPRECPQPMREEYLLTGPLEQTNEPYAIAKIAGIKLCEAFNDQYGTGFVSAMPTNLYGPNDNFDLQSSHVLPALMRKIDTAKSDGAKEVVIWGTGKPMREFLHVDDLADGCVFLMESGVESGIYNIGTGTDVTIRELAGIIADVVGYEGEFVFDSDKPDGTPRKLLDVSRLSDMGWRAKMSLRDGIAQTYEWYRQQT